MTNRLNFVFSGHLNKVWYSNSRQFSAIKILISAKKINFCQSLDNYRTTLLNSSKK